MENLCPNEMAQSLIGFEIGYVIEKSFSISLYIIFFLLLCKILNKKKMFILGINKNEEEKCFRFILHVPTPDVLGDI